VNLIGSSLFHVLRLRESEIVVASEVAVERAVRKRDPRGAVFMFAQPGTFERVPVMK
jgi:hypothetical protein